MADNIDITPGTGKTIATDDAAGVHFQKVKLADGTADSTAMIPGDATNGLFVQVRQAKRLAQYRAATAAPFAAPAGTAPFFAFQGSATKTIRVKRLRVSGFTLTAVAYASIELGKYSTAVSGGTSTALTKVPLDSNDAAATANIVNVYTVAPTAGSLVGIIGDVRPLLEATTAAAGNQPPTIEWDFRAISDDRGGLVLRGTAEGIALNFDAAPASVVTLVVEIEWTEE